MVVYKVLVFLKEWWWCGLEDFPDFDGVGGGVFCVVPCGDFDGSGEEADEFGPGPVVGGGVVGVFELVVDVEFDSVDASVLVGCLDVYGDFSDDDGGGEEVDEEDVGEVDDIGSGFDDFNGGW